MPRFAVPLAAGTMGAVLLLAVAPAAAAGNGAVVGATAGPVGGPRLGGAGVVVPAGAPALPAALSASSWLVADLVHGDVLAARHPHGRFAPASTLKMLTATVLLPRLNPRSMIVATDADARVDGSRVGLVPGQRVSVESLFTALLMVSANDAAVSLSRAAGGVPVTVNRLNAEARRLGAADTVARTVHGLDAPGQSSSAYDLALIARAGMALPAFRRYVAARQGRFPAPKGRSFQIYTHNRLLPRYPGTIGIKNGFTRKAKASYVGAATRNGRTLVVTLMHAGPTVWREAEALLDWGFAAAGRVRPVGMLVAPQPAAAGKILARRPVPTPAASAAGAVRRAAGNDRPGPAALGLGAVTLAVLGGVALAGTARWRRRYAG